LSALHSFPPRRSSDLFKQDVKRFKVVSTMLRPALLDSFPQLRIEDVYAGSNKVYSGSRGWAGLLVFDRATLRLEKQYFGKNNVLDRKSTRLNSSHVKN